MLLAMLIVWITQGSPRYGSMASGQRIAYISDVGAYGLQPLFIAGSCVTTVFLDLSFLSERWLRHTGRLARNLGVAEKVLSALSIVFALVGTVGLILLAIFDNVNYPRLHDGFLLLFMGMLMLDFLPATRAHLRDARLRWENTGPVPVAYAPSNVTPHSPQAPPISSVCRQNQD